MATEYVSAEWMEPVMPGGSRMIKAIGDDGLEYFLPGDDPLTYDVPPWPTFLETELGKAFISSIPEPEPK